MRDFFEREDVCELQQTQKTYPPDSLEHQIATDAILFLAKLIGAERYFE